MTNRVDFLNANLEKLVQSRTEDLTRANTTLEETNSGDIFVGAPESEAMSLFAEAVHSLQKTIRKSDATFTAETSLMSVSGSIKDCWILP